MGRKVSDLILPPDLALSHAIAMVFGGCSCPECNHLVVISNEQLV